MATDQPPPVVFVSYSHDSPEHKRWVGELASRLRANGVDVILDQWDLRYGDDVPKFMERAVRDAQRVLLVCTETYVRKANDGIGGVGYESMIVTGELIRDLGTAKFIPIVRQSADPPKLPTAVSTRFFVNLSRDDQFEQELDRLLRELHRVPPDSKPPLGRNPFALERTGVEHPARVTTAPSTVFASSIDFNNAGALYKSARTIAMSDDILAWRTLVRECRG